MSPAVQRTHAVKQLFEDDVAGLKAYEAPDAPCPLQFHLVSSAAELHESDVQACIELVEQTSGADYRASRIGWNRRKKREEMLDKDMIYLLVRQRDMESASEAETRTQHQLAAKPEARTEAKPAVPQKRLASGNHSDRKSKSQSDHEPHLTDLEQLAHGYVFSDNEHKTPTVNAPSVPGTPILGFLSFMFTFDDPPYEDRPVVYIYEIHLVPRLRGHGLGSRLMAFAEHAARRCAIDKTMLTVFTANAGARAIYEKLGYARDACSPRDRTMRSKVVPAEYVIMSKMV